MSFGKSIALVTSGLMAGVITVLSCADDSPGNADAAACECPASEPPLTSARYQIVDVPATIAANDTGGQGAGCPVGTLFLAGSCTTATLNPLRDVTLQQSGFFDASDQGVQSWQCRFKNNEATPVTVKASVICLKPAP